MRLITIVDKLFPDLENWHKLISKVTKHNFFPKFYGLLIRIGVSPNQLTLFGHILALAAVICLFNDRVLYFSLMFSAYIIDIIDGDYARFSKTASKTGEILDHVGDNLITFLILVKSTLVLKTLLAPTALLLFLTHTLIGYIAKTIRKNPPDRTYISFYLFGLYNLGLAVYIVKQPLTWYRLFKIYKRQRTA